MKKSKLLLTVFILLLLLQQGFSQTPQKFSYQGICRDNTGAVVQNQAVNIRLSIHDLISTGSIVYQETFAIITNQFGLITLDVGNGTVQSGIFATIPWDTGDKFLEIEMDLGTGYLSMGTTQLISVPYALHSKTAETITGTVTESDPIFIVSPANVITSADITNWNTVYGWGNHSTAGYLISEIDGSVTNEIQVLSISNDTLYLSSGGFVKLPAGFDGQYSSLTGTPTNVSTFTNDAGYLTSFTEVDGSVTNEIQALSISNDTIRLSNGGFVKLPAGFNGQYSSLTGAPTNVSTFTNDAGYLTTFTEVDGSVTNELQALSVSNDTIYLSNGGFAKLPASNAWGLNGNTGTNSTTNFIGTTDNVTLNFKVNNQKSGRIDPAGTTFFGYQAGNVDAGSANTGFGIQSLFSNTSGDYNTAIGNWALSSNVNGNHNTAVGKAAMLSNISGHENTAIGLQAMYFSTSGYRNVALGYDALLYNVSGGYNVAIGTKSGENNLGSGNVFLGYQAGFNETGSNKLYIANSSTNPPLIYGDFATGNIGIGTTSLSAKLHIGNGTRFVASNDASIFLQSGNGIGSARDWKIYVPMPNGNLSFKDMGFDNLNNGMAADAMVIQMGTGNVGIGTNTPNARLDLGLGYGTSGEKFLIYNDDFTGPLAGTKTGFYLDRFSLQNNVTFVFPTAPAFPGSYMIAKKNTASTTLVSLMTILGESGNVGIGTTTPTSLLHVKGTADPLQIMIENVGGNFKTGYAIKTALQEWFIGQQSLASTSFRIVDVTNLNAVRLQIEQTTGNVGIGTTTPTAKLHVNGNAKFGSTSMINIWEWDGIEKIGLDYNTVNGDFNMRNPTAGKRLLGTISPTGSWGIETTAGTEMVRITGAGNMGIGTLTPGAKLEINGNLLFTGSSTVSPAAGLFNLTVRAGDGPASGGTMTLRGGQAGSTTGGAGGNLELQGGGNMPSGGAGYGNLGVAGAVNIIGGMGYNSIGGNVSIAAGATSCWALGGAVHSDVTIRGGMNYAVADAASIVTEGGYVSGGCSGNSTGGNIILKAGIGQGTGQSGKILMVGLPVYPNNAAAIAGGLPVGAIYRTGADPDPVCIVH